MLLVGQALIHCYQHIEQPGRTLQKVFIGDPCPSSLGHRFDIDIRWEVRLKETINVFI
jgi:hypothetical protein